MNKDNIATLNASLNKEAGIYKELAKQPDWWKRLLSINGVYVEIRKGDIVDVYFEGGRIAELKYKNNRLTATCHPKYLGKNVPSDSNPKYDMSLDDLLFYPLQAIPYNHHIVFSRKYLG